MGTWLELNLPIRDEIFLREVQHALYAEDYCVQKTLIGFKAKALAESRYVSGENKYFGQLNEL